VTNWRLIFMLTVGAAWVGITLVFGRYRPMFGYSVVFGVVVLTIAWFCIKDYEPPGSP